MEKLIDESLSDEESQKIVNAIKIRGWKTARIAEAIGVSRGHFINMLTRRRPLQPKYAMKLDEIFGYDADFAFLGNYYEGLPSHERSGSKTEGMPPKILEIDLAWTRLYEAHSASLRRIYIQQPVEKKKQIVGELERIIDSYK